MLHCTITTNDSQIDVPAKKMPLTVEVIQHKNNPNCVYTKIIDSCMSLDVLRLNSSRLVHVYGDVSPLECHSFNRMWFTHKNTNQKNSQFLLPAFFHTCQYILFVVCMSVGGSNPLTQKYIESIQNIVVVPKNIAFIEKLSNIVWIGTIDYKIRVFITNIKFTRDGWFCLWEKICDFSHCCKLASFSWCRLTDSLFFCYFFHRRSNVCGAKSIGWSDKKRCEYSLLDWYSSDWNK